MRRDANARRAHAYALRSLRSLGRELMAGSWSRDAQPLSAEQAVAVMTRAMASCLKLGIASAVNALDDALRDLLG